MLNGVMVTKMAPEKISPPLQIDPSADGLAERVAELDAIVFRCWARQREESIKAGRAFNELKKLLGHGKWRKHFNETFAPSGISLRTAERYMKRAKTADAKSDKLTILRPAIDPGAQQVRSATERAEAETAVALSHSKSKQAARLYRLPLQMTAQEMDSMDGLRKLREWPQAEKQIVRLLRRLWNKYGIVKKGTGRRS